MEELYRLFALAWVEEQNAWTVLVKYEKVVQELGIEPMADETYKTLLSQWGDAEDKRRDLGKELLVEWRKEKAGEAFTVLAAD
jgi:hypothetical protein